MSEEKGGLLDAIQLKKRFDLEKGNSTFSEGSTTGVKGNAALGEGYLSEDKFNSLRNSDKIWDAYADLHGEEAMQTKRENNPDGLSINALDAVIDAKTKAGGQEKTTEKEPEVELSPEMQQAKDRVNQWEEAIWSGETSDAIYGVNNETNDSEYDTSAKAAQSFADRKVNETANAMTQAQDRIATGNRI